MQTLESIRGILGNCRYKEWRWKVEPVEVGRALLTAELEHTTHYYLQAEWDDTDNFPPYAQVLARSRKYLLSSHMTDTEVVQTAFLAVLKAEEHEARERFLFLERAIFNGHIRASELWKCSKKFDIREKQETAMTAD